MTPPERGRIGVVGVLDALSHYLPPLVPLWRWAMNRDEDKRAAAETKEALQAMLDLFESHDRWCGYNLSSPGDPIVTSAPEMARRALGRP